MRLSLSRTPDYGDRRVRTGFLWFPRKAENLKTELQEIRWLEKAIWTEKFIRRSARQGRPTWYLDFWNDPK